MRLQPEKFIDYSTILDVHLSYAHEAFSLADQIKLLEAVEFVLGEYVCCPLFLLLVVANVDSQLSEPTLPGTSFTFSSHSSTNPKRKTPWPTTATKRQRSYSRNVSTLETQKKCL